MIKAAIKFPPIGPLTADQQVSFCNKGKIWLVESDKYVEHLMNGRFRPIHVDIYPTFLRATLDSFVIDGFDQLVMPISTYLLVPNTKDNRLTITLVSPNDDVILKFTTLQEVQNMQTCVKGYYFPH